jgi:colanic acid/amylovoran biosynthesis glycosyltransferase
MRVAFLLYQFPALSETFILRQIVGLLDMGHDVHIYAERGCDEGLQHPEVIRHDLVRRTTYVRMPSESGQYEMSVWPPWGATWQLDTGARISNGRRLLRAVPTALRCFARYPRLTCEVLTVRHYDYQAASLSALYRLSALSREADNFDVLHAHFGPIGRSFRFARRLWGAPLVVSFHGYDFSTWPRRHGTKAYAAMFDEADTITVHTEYAERKLQTLGCPDDKLRRLECGIDIREFPFRVRRPPADRPIRILTVARLVEKKGVEYSIRAVAQLLGEGYDLHYEIIGDGPLRTQLMSLCNDLGVCDRIAFAGARNSDYVRDSMVNSDLFVLASHTSSDGDTEGAPVSLLEAQACGMPVVSTQHAGIPEIVADKLSGFLVAERDAAGLAGAIRRLISNYPSWPAMGAHGRAYVTERHDLTLLNRQLADIYTEAVARDASRWLKVARRDNSHSDNLAAISET